MNMINLFSEPKIGMKYITLATAFNISVIIYS